MAKHKKTAPAARKSAVKPAKKVFKKVAPVPAKKNNASPAKPAAPKPAPAPAKPAAKHDKSEPATGKSRPPIPAPAAPAGKSRPPMPLAVVKTSEKPDTDKAAGKATAKANARELLRSRILGAKKTSKPIAFSLDEVREIAKTTVAKVTDDAAAKSAKPSGKTATLKPDLTKLAKPAQPHHIKAASLADILGFNPKKAQKPTSMVDPESVPEKFRRYYRILLELRTHLTEGISLHSEETLKRSSKDDSGDLSSYGQHMADAGTDTFDRDFALSLVSSEQEALTEIEAAIKRIHDGTYGICEASQKPIAKERLLAVPFTRFSAEAQKDIEKNRFRSRSAAGIFGEMGEEGGGKMEVEGGGEE